MDMCIEWKSQDTNQYAILLILTDGCIHDMDQTKSALVDSAFLPLSIIIVGIGNADFSNMEILDGDDGLWDSKGRKAQRDLVQFVPFHKFNGDPIKLAEEVLEELPRQLVEYMVSINKMPNPAQLADLSQISRSNTLMHQDSSPSRPIQPSSNQLPQQQPAFIPQSAQNFGQPPLQNIMMNNNIPFSYRQVTMPQQPMDQLMRQGTMPVNMQMGNQADYYQQQFSARQIPIQNNNMQYPPANQGQNQAMNLGQNPAAFGLYNFPQQ